MPKVKQILFPIDFSEPCASVVVDVKAAVTHFDARLTLLHAPSIGLLREAIYPGKLYSALLKEIRERSTKAMDHFVRRHFPSAGTNHVIDEGDPAEVIVQHAQQYKIDLIMMPTHGYGPFRRFLTGSVAAKVLHDALCPVWTSAHTERTRLRAQDYRNILCAVDCTSDAVALMRWAVWIGRRYQATVKLVHVIPALNETSRNRGEMELRRYLVR